jgi:hypothetical protein
VVQASTWRQLRRCDTKEKGEWRLEFCSVEEGAREGKGEKGVGWWPTSVRVGGAAWVQRGTVHRTM